MSLVKPNERTNRLQIVRTPHFPHFDQPRITRVVGTNPSLKPLMMTIAIVCGLIGVGLLKYSFDQQEAAVRAYSWMPRIDLPLPRLPEPKNGCENRLDRRVLAGPLAISFVVCSINDHSMVDIWEIRVGSQRSIIKATPEEARQFANESLQSIFPAKWSNERIACASGHYEQPKWFESDGDDTTVCVSACGQWPTCETRFIARNSVRVRDAMTYLRMRSALP